MFSKVLIANRGVVAVRIARTLRDMGILSVGVYADSDRDSGHIPAVDEAYCLGEGAAAATYLNHQRIIDLAVESGAEAIHPGYGFLSENAQFASAVEAAGLRFIGPRPEHLRSFGLKHEARQIAERAGVSLLPASGVLDTVQAALQVADEIGYPVMLKSSAGGGGIGMQRCGDAQALSEAYTAVRRLAEANFGDSNVFVEKCLDQPRHVEVQVFGDGRGGVLAIGDRDCSLQRRHQKVIEECPAPGLPDAIREQLHAEAIALLESTRYASAGTVEFLYDASAQQFYFLEVNTRLQVEHGVTELVFDVDLVRWMVELASGAVTSVAELKQPGAANGHAIQARLYAEDPLHDFRPTPGQLGEVTFPAGQGLRVDTWVGTDVLVPHQFDPLLANVMFHAADRAGAISGLAGALSHTRLTGIRTNRDYCRQALEFAPFAQAAMHTHILAQMQFEPDGIEVLRAGLQSTLQSYPGRLGYWDVGVPPSGPMDDLSFRLGNRLLGNAPDAAGLEMTVAGPALSFHCAARCVVTGAEVPVTLDGQPVAMWTPFDVVTDQVLDIGKASCGARAYLLVAGGFDVPRQMGSSATFTLGQMGGLNGRAIAAGDELNLGRPRSAVDQLAGPLSSPPDLDSRYSIRVLIGPHTSPDFFTEQDIDTILSADWKVHHNSSRTGVRLIGPQPDWARSDGGEAGMHPSNIHDNAYAIGSIDFTGDMPVILGPDGPSLGGFVCPGVVIMADRWKLGQLMPGDEIRFIPVSEPQAVEALSAQDEYLASAGEWPVASAAEEARTSPVLFSAVEADAMQNIVIRRSGQEALLIELGPPVLDIDLRMRIHQLMLALQADPLPGVLELTPGIRSLQIRFDARRWRTPALLDALAEYLSDALTGKPTPVASRVVHLPLSWEDPACLEAVQRYMSGVRNNAPWCPDNVEFIRRMNGLAEKSDVQRIVFDASYLVMGLGDVYLGAPVATPIDPRHRLVTTKYNPARTWTAQNSVGIGGSYMCIYGMEGPGGYQFVGRTVQVWNARARGGVFEQPWLLRHFDQIRFYPVDAQELLEMREAFPRGGFEPQIEEVVFDPQRHAQMLRDNAQEITQFKARQTEAFAQELDMWKQQGLLSFEAVSDAPASPLADVPEGELVLSPMAASVWQLTAADQAVAADDVIVVLEAMKAEIEVRAPVGGTVTYLVDPGQSVTSGQPVAVIS